MLNKNVMNIAKFDFLNTLKSKGFIILNIVLCLLVIIAINLTSIINLFKSSGIIKSSNYVLEVYDTTGDVFEALKNTFDSNKITEVKKLDKKTEYTFENIKEDTIVINVEQSSENSYDKVEVITKDTVSQDIYEYITNTITNVRNEAIELKYGITNVDSEMYKADVVITETILSNAKNQNTITQLITTAIGYLIFMLVMTITTTVASNIANEKTSKSAEYIFSTIPAKDYLNGKVVAANLKTIVTIILIVFYVLLGLVINSALFTNVSVENIEITINPQQIANIGNPIGYIVIVLLLIFITNTLISYIQAWLASRIKSISELDSAIMLPTVVLVIAYFVSNMIFEAGNIAIYITSCIPILSMFILPTAYLLNKASSILLIISFAILIITLFIVYKMVTSTFKNNILDLGKKKIDKEQEEIKLKDIENKKIEKIRLGNYITCVAFSLILSLVLGNIVGIIPMFFTNEIANLLINILVFVVYIGLPALILSKLVGKFNIEILENNEKDNRKTKCTMYFVGLCGLLVAQILNIIFITIFNIPQSKAMEQALQIPSSNIGIMLFLVYIALIPAIFEELLFRKAMLDGAKRFGIGFAIIFTSLMFGLFHQNLQQILGTGIIGIVLAYVTIKTGDIKTSIMLHFTNNLFAALLQVIFTLQQGTLVLVFEAIELLILILLVIGVIATIKLLITDREKLKIKNDNIKPKIRLSTIISNYYMIILLAMIISTVIVYLKI